LTNTKKVVLITGITGITAQDGSYSKARKKLNWEPKTSFNELAQLMVESDLKYHKTGELL
jgi:GDP-D-mannose dehydratase